MVKLLEIALAGKLTWNGDPVIGWWNDDRKFLTMYHGTHDRNVQDILKNGLTKMDPDTGMLSMAFEPSTAHGYAAMSGAGGESGFIKAGAKPVHTAEKDRSVIVAKIPMDWVRENMDLNLGGNLGTERKRLQSKDEWEKWNEKQENNDQGYYQLAELRFKKTLPPKFITGYMKKK